MITDVGHVSALYDNMNRVSCGHSINFSISNKNRMMYIAFRKYSHPPRLFPHFAVLQSGIKIDFIVIFLVNDKHTQYCVKVEETY
jgi:hypothetical protein